MNSTNLKLAVAEEPVRDDLPSSLESSQPGRPEANYHRSRGPIVEDYKEHRTMKMTGVKPWERSSSRLQGTANME